MNVFLSLGKLCIIQVILMWVLIDHIFSRKTQFVVALIRKICCISVCNMVESYNLFSHFLSNITSWGLHLYIAFSVVPFLATLKIIPFPHSSYHLFLLYFFSPYLTVLTYLLWSVVSFWKVSFKGLFHSILYPYCL
jgi:hypothetical protein